MGEIFSRFPSFIQEYIYRSGWEDLREIQIKAADVIFNTEKNLLITSPTASGKTEATLFPIITRLYEKPSLSFGILYIAPLKSLINDQFLRLDTILDESGLPVYHWHGDVATSHKTKALKNPAGILQITPESLESMLMNRHNDIVRLFCDLRYVILDEVHTLMGSDRGNQILCQLCRIGKIIGHNPIRIGLSATIGNIEKAAEWLGSGSGRDTATVGVRETKTKWKLGAEHFYIQNDDANQTDDIAKVLTPKAKPDPTDKGFEFVYDCSMGKKTLIFSNSREETEQVTATLRQIAKRRVDSDIFHIHHGNLSASIREETEMSLKNDEMNTVTCATTTLELGIDIGRLERIIQMGSPLSVSSMLQRIGRSGRRGQPPEMMLVFREENPLPNTPLPQLIPWELIRAIAIIQLYVEERFIEPPKTKKFPFSLMFQQTLSILASSGALPLSKLAEKVLSLPPFVFVSKEDYKQLIVSMIRNDYIELTEERELIVGLNGEKLTNSFKFYAVFKDSEDFTVRSGSDEIGTITTPPPVGDRFALAGRVWEVEELDLSRHLIYVHQVDGKMEISWPGDYGEVHTKILERMKKVLAEDIVYPYLKPNAAKRLDVARRVARNTGMLEHSCVNLGGYTWCLFPWLGTCAFRTMRKMIAKNGSRLGISRLEYDGCYYITFKMERGDGKSLAMLLSDCRGDAVDRNCLVSATENPVFEKYDEFIPSELLRRAYSADRLETDEVLKRIEDICGECNV